MLKYIQSRITIKKHNSKIGVSRKLVISYIRLQDIAIQKKLYQVQDASYASWNTIGENAQQYAQNMHKKTSCMNYEDKQIS